MLPSGDAQGSEVEWKDLEGTRPSEGGDGNLEPESEEEVEEEEMDDEEEEDVDFNPFLMADSPSEASSSLSSEDEGSADSPKMNLERCSDHQGVDASSRPNDELVNGSRDSGNEYGEVVTETRFPLEGVAGEEAVLWKPEERELTSDTQKGGQEPTSAEGIRGENIASVETEPSKVKTRERSPALTITSSLNLTKSLTPVMGVDDEDAICRRTRARHSLVNYTLEELETFLQESDDDDDIQNVDDEEEYRKFLAAVLLGENDNDQERQEDENLDEDEENDADFEIEIEEALESDVDENIQCSNEQGEDCGGAGHRPETRQKKSQKDFTKYKKKLLGQAKVPLRPILPSVSNTQVVPFRPHGWDLPFTNMLPERASSSSNTDLEVGFTAQQIGQLFCLIHEHVQLLIQIFSLSVHDPSRQHVANMVQMMISEMAGKREEALAWQKASYPAYCFDHLHVYQSADCDPHDIADSSWVPSVGNPVLSVLDVSSLGLARKYITDVSATMQRYRQNQMEGVYDKCQLKKEPLFPLTCSASTNKAIDEVPGGASMTCPRAIPPLSPNQGRPKKSLAATLVENTKKQSVALVPDNIACLAQIFVALFNAALFPHKPPPTAVASRVLFTDAEDGLLAMGLMEYNSDWTAIQKRFLPCKSKHQIYVRQKNRSSSKAPENPIKIVRRIKSSPLSADEKALVSKGLKIFKHDWISVWKFFVPHRDPSLLPRQWRIATGTQKSYRKDEVVKQKRRLYEAKRRKLKAFMSGLQTMSENEDDSGQIAAADIIDDGDEAFVHEAFLVDAGSGSPKQTPPEPALSSITNRTLPSSNIFPYGVSSSRLPSTYRMRKNRTDRVVKLAPDLPPVNLPPSVRVISQSAFKSYHSVSSHYRIGDSSVKKLVPGLSCDPKVGTSTTNAGKSKTVFMNNDTKVSDVHDQRTPTDHHVAEENNPESDLQMHPLLFQSSEVGCSTYYPRNCGTTVSSSSNFFSAGHLLQSNPNLFKLDQSGRPIEYAYPVLYSKRIPLGMHTIDFHPLLQRTDDVNVDSAIASRDGCLPSELEPLQGNDTRILYPPNCTPSRSQINNSERVNSASLTGHEKECELDLDIHLCSATNKRKTTRGGDMTACQSRRSSCLSKLHIRSGEKGKHANAPSHDHKRNCDESRVAANSSVYTGKNITGSDYESGAFVKAPKVDSLQMALSKSGKSQFTEDNLGDQPSPEIVMEQEELSDSDEEIEHVEFECEEMDDSEGEGLDGEQLDDVHDKVIPTIADEENEILATKDEQQCERFHKSEAIEKDRGHADPMQLCTASCTAGPLMLTTKQNLNRGPSCKGSQNRLQCHPSRSSRQTSKSSKLQAPGTPQLHLGVIGECNTVTSRKSRKR